MMWALKREDGRYVQQYKPKRWFRRVPVLEWTREVNEAKTWSHPTAFSGGSGDTLLDIYNFFGILTQNVQVVYKSK